MLLAFKWDTCTMRGVPCSAATLAMRPAALYHQQQFPLDPNKSLRQVRQDSLDIDIIIAEIPRLPVPPRQIIHHIRMTQTLFNLLRIPRVPFHRDNLAQITHHPQVPLLVFVPVRHNHLRPLLGDLVHEVAPQEAGAPKDGRNVPRDGGAAAGGRTVLDDGGCLSAWAVLDNEVVRELCMVSLRMGA